MSGFSQKPEDALRVLADRLVSSYAGPDPDRGREISSMVEAEANRFDGAKVRTFVPILVERAVRGRLDRQLDRRG